MYQRNSREDRLIKKNMYFDKEKNTQSKESVKVHEFRKETCLRFPLSPPTPKIFDRINENQELLTPNTRNNYKLLHNVCATTSSL